MGTNHSIAFHNPLFYFSFFFCVKKNETKKGRRNTNFSVIASAGLICSPLCAEAKKTSEIRAVPQPTAPILTQ